MASRAVFRSVLGMAAVRKERLISFRAGRWECERVCEMVFGVRGKESVPDVSMNVREFVSADVYSELWFLFFPSRGEDDAGRGKP